VLKLYSLCSTGSYALSAVSALSRRSHAAIDGDGRCVKSFFTCRTNVAADTTASGLLLPKDRCEREKTRCMSVARTPQSAPAALERGSCEASLEDMA
jgi:hypothetical protein